MGAPGDRKQTRCRDEGLRLLGSRVAKKFGKHTLLSRVGKSKPADFSNAHRQNPQPYPKFPPNLIKFKKTICIIGSGLPSAVNAIGGSSGG